MINTTEANIGSLTDFPEEGYCYWCSNHPRKKGKDYCSQDCLVESLEYREIYKLRVWEIQSPS